MIGVASPELLGARRMAIDYEHYVDKQLQLVVDTILPPVGDDFTILVNQ